MYRIVIVNMYFIILLKHANLLYCQVSNFNHNHNNYYWTFFIESLQLAPTCTNNRYCYWTIQVQYRMPRSFHIFGQLPPVVIIVPLSFCSIFKHILQLCVGVAFTRNKVKPNKYIYSQGYLIKASSLIKHPLIVISFCDSFIRFGYPHHISYSFYCYRTLYSTPYRKKQIIRNLRDTYIHIYETENSCSQKFNSSVGNVCHQFVSINLP